MECVHPVQEPYFVFWGKKAPQIPHLSSKSRKDRGCEFLPGSRPVTGPVHLYWSLAPAPEALHCCSAVRMLSTSKTSPVTAL